MTKKYSILQSLILFGIVTCGVSASFAADGPKIDFKRSFEVSFTDHITLDVAVPEGDVNIAFLHAGELAISATVRSDDNKPVPADFFENSLKIDRQGNHIQIRFVPNPRYSARDFKVTYNIDVPNEIEVNSNVENGRQTVSGVTGPVKLLSGSGDIKALYIATTLEAKTGTGNISVIRTGGAANVETGGGNISLRDIGPGSVATVKKGTGRIEMDGVSGSFNGATAAGELDVKGGVYGDWELKSSSGNIRILVSKEFKYDIDALTRSGQLAVHNEDIDTQGKDHARQCRQKVNGGGKVVRARTESGNIFFD